MKVTENKDKTYQWNEVKQKQRDNYHIILLAKNYEGVKEINSLVSMANDDNHMYYKPRISFEEASKISDNVIISSACLASPLWSWKRTVMDYKTEIESIKAEILQWQANKEKFIAELNGETTVRKKKRKPELIEADIQKCDDYLHNLIINTKNISADMEDITFNINNKEKWFTKLFYRYDYLEVQPHVNSNDQKEFNRWLLDMSRTYHKPIVCGTDTHSFDSYAAECRTIMQIAKGIEFLEEDTFDLTLKTYDELVQMFREQGVLSEEEIEIALNNTNVIADSVEDFELDKSFKYPIFDTPENDAKTFEQKCWEGLEEKIKCGAIDINKKQEYIDRINEELRVMNKLKMCGFMLSMHYLVGQLRAEGIPFGFSRGSCFTKNALIHTDSGLKTIDKVVVGDKVLSADGEFHKVYNTTSYNVCEDMIEIEHYQQGSCKKKYNNLCTADHRILINRDGIVDYIAAKDVQLTDLLCYPVVQNNCNVDMVIDLNKYNVFGYSYDNNYIYEEVSTNIQFPYSFREMERNHIFCRNVLHSQIKHSIGQHSQQMLDRLHQYTPFPTFEHYKKYLNSHMTIKRKIPRYIKLDALTNAFIGLMYGDGWTNNGHRIGLAINSTSKNVYNRYVLEKFAKRFNLTVYYNKSKIKDLEQGYINSRIITQWIATDFFESKRGTDKIFNPYLFNQPTKYLKFLLDGLTRSDGSLAKRNQIRFDNTSLSLIAAYRHLYNIVKHTTMALDIRLEHQDKRGWTNSESYKLRSIINNTKITHDDKYYYLPIKNIVRHSNMSTTVYDLSVQDNPSFVVNNMIVHNCGACLCAYLTDITDCDSIVWDLDFARFCNENRVSLADIDLDLSAEDEDYVLQCMINTIGAKKVAHVFALGTNQKLGAIDDIGRALARKWVNQHGKDTKELKIQKRQIQHSALTKEERKAKIDAINDQIHEIDKYNDKLDNPYSLKRIAQIKKEFNIDEEQCIKNHQDIFYYFDGIVDVKISASIHPAGNICAERTLDDNYGIMINDGKRVIQLDMDAAHDVNLVKYDLLKLKSVSVLSKICQYLGKPYPRSYEVDWNDKSVWDDMSHDNLAIPQFESNFSFQLINTMHPNNVEELAMINAAIRPAGASYRDELTHRIQHHGANPDVDKMLEPTYGRLCFQEQVMQFLQKFCGFSGSESDNMRRLISSKDSEKIENAIPQIVDGYCQHRDLPRKQAEEEAQEYVQVIRDASSYAFNKSHAVAYSMLGYMFAYMKHYHPAEFICAFLNYADNDDDVTNGTKLALERGYKIEEPTFRHGRSEYSFDNDKRIIYKGMSSIKYMNEKSSEQLFLIGKQQYDNFFEVLRAIKNKTSVNSRQLDLLIKLNFFKEFGNIKKLMKYVELFDMFKQGDISIINRAKINSDTIWKVVTRIAEVDNDIEKVNIKKTKANGCVAIFKELSELLDCMDIKEFSFKDRIAWQKEFLGYINLTTGLDEDRKKLFITSMRPIIAKKGRHAGKAWCRIITTHSIGRGIDGEWWVLEETYQKYYRFNEGDIIIAGKVRPEKYQDKKQWWLDSYELCMD